MQQDTAAQFPVGVCAEVGQQVAVIGQVTSHSRRDVEQATKIRGDFPFPPTMIKHNGQDKGQGYALT